MSTEDKLKNVSPTFGNTLLAVVLGIFRKMFKIFTKISCLKIN